MDVALIEVEVAYALSERQWLIALEMAEGATIEAAIAASGLLAQCPEMDLTACQVGIFGRVCGLDTVLRHEDRIEIYRPLQQLPMAARRGRIVRR